jgi:hypothetical protein
MTLTKRESIVSSHIINVQSSDGCQKKLVNVALLIVATKLWIGFNAEDHLSFLAGCRIEKMSILVDTVGQNVSAVRERKLAYVT